ncbi:hypothetical protein J2847_005874 [Azospirillum agricola]|uniref:hypothetical protein n=1 Tax=Azospirillum agricola TaxID=1720247 RepID=UPI001AE23771|nr:hypothetical protein [Azospirillum agricola]MBP2232545.1 hypothetical protein [Azospirillum agricola]
MDEKKRRLALQANKLCKEGLKGKAIGEKLKVTTDEANTLARIGRDLADIDEAALTASEVLLIRSIATVTLRLRAQDVIRTPKSWEVAAVAHKSESWVGATSRKRLRLPCHHLVNQPGQPLGLVNFTTNGFVGLTPLGWAFVQAIEAAEAANEQLKVSHD